MRLHASPGLTNRLAAAAAFVAATSAAAAGPASYELSGIVRDFLKNHPDFNKSTGAGMTGHVAGNVNSVLDVGNLPVFSGAGFRVTTEWKDSAGRNIAPQLYGVAPQSCSAGAAGIAALYTVKMNNQAQFFGCIKGVVPVGGTPALISTNSALQTMIRIENSSTYVGNIFVGAGGNTNLASPMCVVLKSTNSTFTGTIANLTAPIPIATYTAPTTLGVNTGNYIVSGTQTLSSNLHCGKFHVRGSGRLEISGHVTVLADDSVNLESSGVGAGLYILPGSTLDLYVNKQSGPGTGMRVETPWAGASNGDPAAFRIYFLAPISYEMLVKGSGARLMARVFRTHGTMNMDTNATFYGTFNGERFDADNNSTVYTDTALAGLGVANDNPGVAGAASTGGISNSSSFAQWYRDVMGVNQSKVHTITMVNNGAGVFEYIDDAFWPIENTLLGNEGAAQNNNFTYMIDADFTYSKCAGQFVEFRSADDGWIFINGNLAMDLGGVIPGQTQYLDLARLNLTDGQACKLHLFFAQRQPSSSQFRLRTNLILTTTVTPTTTFSVNNAAD